MTQKELTACNIDFRAAVAAAEEARTIIDKLAGAAPNQAIIDALAANRAKFEREADYVLRTAERFGIDSIEFTMPDYRLCYVSANGKWEPHD